MVEDTSGGVDAAILEARQKMIARRFGGSGGSATVGGARRKKKAVHKTASADDKKLMTTLKKLGVTNIPAIEEVNMFQDNGEVIHFVNPKVQASVGANTYVVAGNAEIKQLQDLLPGIVNELGVENINALRAMAEGPGGAGAGGATVEEEDDDVPDLVENFDEVASK